MAADGFSHVPVDVPKVRTRFREIKTALPVPETISVLDDLARYEARSMHGQLPVVWDRAEDFQVWDRAGNCWIDFTSTIFVANAGHANPAVKKAIQAALDKNLLHSYTFATEMRARFLRRLVEVCGPPLEKAFLLSSGTEATECAVKLMRLHGRAAGKRKPGILSFEGSMHGRTMGAQLLGGTPAAREWVGHDDPNIHRLPFPYPWALRDGDGRPVSGAEKFRLDLEALRARGVDVERDLAGAILESYIGWGAVFFPVDYVQALVAFARARDILVTFDEIQGGFGRTGTMFVYQHYGVEPDLICCGKGMSSSLPLSAVVGRSVILDLPETGSMSSTHSANPVVCAAGLANLDAIESMNLVAEAARKGRILFERLGGLQRRLDGRIPYVLGDGLLAAVLVADPATGAPDPDTATRVCETAMQKGLLLVHTGRESIKIGPPLTIPDDALAEGLDVLEESFDAVLAGKAPAR